MTELQEARLAQYKMAETIKEQSRTIEAYQEAIRRLLSPTMTSIIENKVKEITHEGFKSDSAGVMRMCSGFGRRDTRREQTNETAEGAGGAPEACKALEGAAGDGDGK